MSVSQSDLRDIVSELLNEKLATMNRQLEVLVHDVNLLKEKTGLVESKQTSSFVNMAFQAERCAKDTQTGKISSSYFDKGCCEIY